ncbi:MAG: hypothetical protein A3J85_07015 [Desulfobacula sp. RIFOXYA12_FULL_46_16]|nr:MAG: hypothetical protein A3J85_07015 [Desulfobacula sp. RIFOXYA12_FULL_46_16]
MASFNELTDILTGLDQRLTEHETGLLQSKFAPIESQYAPYPSLAPFLKMMGALIKYLDSKKAGAHPEAGLVLLSMTRRFEKLVSDFDPERDKDKINTLASEEIKKYKALQNKIASKPVAGDMDLDRLKAVILAIDWEISDGTLQHFETVVREFLSAYHQDKISHHFLKIIQGLGNYIGSRKADAHPDAISFLRAVFDAFEKTFQTPALSYQNKKEILENQIRLFNELKARLSKEKQKLRPGSDMREEEFLPPALSHIKPAAPVSSEDVMTLPLSSEPDESNAEDIVPALSGRRPPAAPRDVMGDLFSLKESPADELLDAIHMMDVHGAGRTPGRNQTLDSPAGGIKQFTPQLKHNEPIAEIGDRLDEFFNLETSPGPSDHPILPADETVELIAELEEDKTEGIVPFQYEDESFEPCDPDEKNREMEIGAQAILDRLRTRLKTLDRANPEPGLSAIKDDIAELTALWQNEPEKTALMELLGLSLDILDPPIPSLPLEEAVNYEKNEPIPEYYREKPPGIFARIKAIFTS